MVGRRERPGGRTVNPLTFPAIKRTQLAGADLDRFKKQVKRSLEERDRVARVDAVIGGCSPRSMPPRPPASLSVMATRIADIRLLCQLSPTLHVRLARKVTQLPRVPNTRRLYDELSEGAHPNYSGSAGAYSKPDLSYTQNGSVPPRTGARLHKRCGPLSGSLVIAQHAFKAGSGCEAVLFSKSGKMT